MVRYDLQSSRLRPDIGAPPRLRPLLVASVAALVYVLVSTMYILVSSRWAATISGSVETLARIEKFKGVGFVLVTGLACFLIVLVLLRRIRDRDALIACQNKDLLASEKAATAGLLAYSVCHDLNNVLAVVEGNLDLLQAEGGLGPAQQEHLHDAQEAARRLGGLTRRLMEVGRDKTPGSVSETDLARLVAETIEFARQHHSLQRCELTFENPGPLRIRINAELVARMLLNLIINAAEAGGDTCRIRIRLTRSADGCRLEVQDAGPGIRESELETIFQPFYTTKQSGSGLGLLSLKVCAEQHQGVLEVGRSEWGGASVGIVFPDATCAVTGNDGSG